MPNIEIKSVRNTLGDIAPGGTDLRAAQARVVEALAAAPKPKSNAVQLVIIDAMGDFNYGPDHAAFASRGVARCVASMGDGKGAGVGFAYHGPEDVIKKG